MDQTPTDQFRAATRHLLDVRGRGAQARLAETTGIDKGHLNGIIKGRAPGSEDVRAKIAAALNMQYEELLALGRKLLAGENVGVMAGEMPALGGHIEASSGPAEIDPEIAEALRDPETRALVKGIIIGLKASKGVKP